MNQIKVDFEDKPDNFIVHQAEPIKNIFANTSRHLPVLNKTFQDYSKSKSKIEDRCNKMNCYEKKLKLKGAWNK